MVFVLFFLGYFGVVFFESLKVFGLIFGLYGLEEFFLVSK